MKKPVLLDLFCGAGGCAVGYHRAGFDVIGVDIYPQPNYPFESIQGDVFEIELPECDVIHASPPCQEYSVAKILHDNIHPRLIEKTRELIKHKPYIIENVPGASLIKPVVVCGTVFNLQVIRHRLFESNLVLVGSGCDHKGSVSDGTYVSVFGNNHSKELYARVMRITWMKKREELAQAIPPVYTEFIGKQIIQQL